ncbi:MAG: hypothetical protein ACKO3I_00810, partial [Synechococcales cyanobacterium]
MVNCLPRRSGGGFFLCFPPASRRGRGTLGAYLLMCGLPSRFSGWAFSGWAFWEHTPTGDRLMEPTAPTTPATAAQALADAREQHQLLASQLAAVAQETAAAEVGTAHHLSLAQRALGLRGQLQELDRTIAGLAEQAKTEVERDQETAAKAKAARAALVARVTQDREKVTSLINSINEASDQLAQALAAAGQYIPPVVEDLRLHGGLRLTGPWPTILPSNWGEGLITRLPWVHLEEHSAMLSTR